MVRLRQAQEVRARARFSRRGLGDCGKAGKLRDLELLGPAVRAAPLDRRRGRGGVCTDVADEVDWATFFDSVGEFDGAPGPAEPVVGLGLHYDGDTFGATEDGGWGGQDFKGGVLVCWEWLLAC